MKSNSYTNITKSVIGASRSEPHTTEFYAFLGILGERSEPHMGDTSGIFHILLLLLLSYVRRGLCGSLFFFYGVRCAQYKVHAQCSFAALAPHMPCMLLVGRAKRAPH